MDAPMNPSIKEKRRMGGFGGLIITKMLKKVKLVEQTDEENNHLFQKIKAEIINQLSGEYNGHIDDIGNLVGIAIGKHIGNKNIWAFKKDDFISGFEHGYSIEDGTHS